MKTRRGTIISCLCALTVTAAGALYFTGGRAPGAIPVKTPEGFSSVSGLGDSANRQAVGGQLLNAMPSVLGTKGRLVTLPQEDDSTQALRSGSAMEMSKPLPPGILLLDQNTESTGRLIGLNHSKNAGRTALPEENEGGGVPPTTDEPVLYEGEPSEHGPNPQSGEDPLDENTSLETGSLSDVVNPEEGQNPENGSSGQENSSCQSEVSGQAGTGTTLL